MSRAQMVNTGSTSQFQEVFPMTGALDCQPSSGLSLVSIPILDSRQTDVRHWMDDG